MPSNMKMLEEFVKSATERKNKQKKSRKQIFREYSKSRESKKETNKTSGVKK